VIGTLSVFTPRAGTEELEDQLELLSIAGSILFHAVQHSRAREEEIQELREENIRLHERLGDRLHKQLILGNSRVMQNLNQMTEKIAATDATVLILGESGTGKGVVAQAIHEMGTRRAKPFVKLNCAALSESIIESELFGHERGSFTGALNQRKGRFEQANGGTIFLDEIGEISVNIQAKLLRVLQEREYERVGGNETLKTDCRVIAATNKDLEKKVRDGEFREDLYYRLNVIPLVVPPLRERRSDITLLADHFIERFNRLNGKKVNRISTPAIDMLMAYHWPGNVRELENAIERAVILSEDDTIHGYHLPPSLQIAEPHVSEKSGEGTLQQRLAALEYEMIVEALKATRGNLSRSAKMLGLTNRMIGIRAEKYGIDFRLYRTGGHDDEDDED
jgi:Nif-specific regulatory protein